VSIAVDQSRLHRISRDILHGIELERREALAILEIVQLAAGVDDDEQLGEHTTLQAIAQHVGSMVGWKPGELCAIPRGSAAIGDDWVALLASQLGSRAARELAYAYAFLVAVGNLELTAAERAELERFQRVLGLDDRRATDLVVRLTEVVASERPRAGA
jgi:hypothetical protein